MLTAMRLKVRPFEKFVNDERWSGAIEDDAYVWRVGSSTYRLRTLSTAADERGAFAEIEPYEEQLDDGRMLRVEAETEELWPPDLPKPVCCRITVVRAADAYLDPVFAQRLLGVALDSVHFIGSPATAATCTNVAIRFFAGGQPDMWVGPARRVSEPRSAESEQRR